MAINNPDGHSPEEPPGGGGPVYTPPGGGTTTGGGSTSGGSSSGGGPRDPGTTTTTTGGGLDNPTLADLWLQTFGKRLAGTPENPAVNSFVVLPSGNSDTNSFSGISAGVLVVIVLVLVAGYYGYQKFYKGGT